ncbi:MAG: tRNA (adenosine(37)-N6)-threonylcarbamoyltransferase complex ATPase subunit type 1 TsaE [Candidatus Brocadiae bacterium]|nr:tRNA (adenosine(37)-N6)-threonylcarbamoyltransferase complex ATPase subunit type 1 TsaE [Candidatus Brocadiia bacterium]
MSEMAVELATGGPDETQAMAAAFAGLCRPDDVVALEGMLGSGKTCFVKGLAVGLGVTDQREVTSPTFVLLHRYAGRLVLHHFDAYRLRRAEEMERIGCAEVFESGGVSVIEWADHVAECLPPEHFLLSIVVADATERHFELKARGPGPRSRMEAFGRVLSAWRRGNGKG